MAVYCPRCGSRFLLDARFCWACADGEADPDRAREVLQAAEAGQSDALRVLGTIDDRQAVPILLEGARHLNADIRRAALSSLGWTADERALPAAIERLADDDDNHVGEGHARGKVAITMVMADPLAQAHSLQT